MNRSGMPLASSFDLWNKMCTWMAIFRDQSRVHRSFFRTRERGKKNNHKEEERRKKKNASGVFAGLFRPLVRRKERFGRQRAKRAGPALRPAHNTCTSACRVPTYVFRPTVGRKERFGPRRADSAIFVEFFRSAYYISNYGLKKI